MTSSRLEPQAAQMGVDTDPPASQDGHRPASSLDPFVDDPDFTLHVGDALETLQAMPAESVHCCVTSPPYWGLRDYGTGEWEGGDASCDHRSTTRTQNLDKLGERYSGGGHKASSDGAVVTQFKDSCGKCGATRIDQQLGLEPTPDQYVARMVNVFREVRRVLRADGTLWLNIGDSYVSQGGNRDGYAANTGQGTRREAEPQGSPRMTSGLLGGDAPASAPGYLAAPGLKAKDLVGIPWRLAFALQADGWYLRSDIIWSKPNPMPESVTDRPTKAHEYLFLLSKSPRYFYDADAIREPNRPDGRTKTVHDTRTNNSHPNYAGRTGGGKERWPNELGRNRRSVWEVVTEPLQDAHFATFPQALVDPCVMAGSPEGGVVLDPFMGAGTTALVARRLGRRSIGIELNADYCELAARRLGQQSLFA